MVEKTPNHDLNKFERGDPDWSHSEDMETAEKRLPVRDVEGNLEEYEPHEGATFVATDTGAVYDGDGESWTPAGRDVEDLRASHIQGDTVEFETFRDSGRFEMRHLNTWNIGGDGKVAETNQTINLDRINKLLLFVEHISTYTRDPSSDSTFAVQYNGQTSGYHNHRLDGSRTTDDYAIVAQGARNKHPWMGNVWFHLDQDFVMNMEGGSHGQASESVQLSTHDYPGSSRPWEFDNVRFFSPDSELIRMRRATLFGFTAGANR